jgi:hypothetical protein
MIEWLTSGRFWLVKCLACLIFCGFFFSCVPVFLQGDQTLLPAYELKARNPFADTTKLTVPEHLGERRHGNKITYRIFGSILLWATKQLSLNPYYPAIIGGCLLLLSGLLVGNRIAEDRATGLFLGMTYAGLYATSASFSINHTSKPFDGIALGLVGLATIVDRPFFLFLISFLACWTDERAIVSLTYISLIILSSGLLEMRAKVIRCVSIAATVLAYLGLRLVLSRLFDWNYLDTAELGTRAIKQTLPYLGWAAWVGLEGGWILIAFALSNLWKRKTLLQLAVFLGFVVLCVASNLIVYDTSRTASFSFPLIAVALGIMKAAGSPLKQIRDLTAASALVSLLSQNFEVIAGVMLKWLPPLSAWYLNRL